MIVHSFFSPYYLYLVLEGEKGVKEDMSWWKYKDWKENLFLTTGSISLLSKLLFAIVCDVLQSHIHLHLT